MNYNIENVENYNFNVNVYEDESVDACIRNLRKDASSLADMSLGIERNTSKVVDNTSKVVDNTSKVVDNTSKVVDNTSKVVDNTSKVVDEINRLTMKVDSLQDSQSKIIGLLTIIANK